MAYPYDGLLFRHKREEEALNILIWNKPQGTLFTKQSKLKMASKECHHEWKTTAHADTSISVCIPGKVHKGPATVGALREKQGQEGDLWGSKVRKETCWCCTKHLLNLLHLKYVLRLPIQK